MLLTAIIVAGASVTPSYGQDRPAPSKPKSQASSIISGDPNNPIELNGNGLQTINSQPRGTSPVRPEPTKEDKILLAFEDVSCELAIPLIARATGKVVMPVNLTALKSKRFTLRHELPVDRKRALDLVLTALRLNGVGIIETDELVILDLIENIPLRQPTVLGPQDDVMNRLDLGSYVVKIFRLREAPAETVAERLQDTLPDYASIGVDANSNQIIMHGDIGLAQHVQRLIYELDRNYVEIKTETFRLAYADASEIAEQIIELFEESEQSSPSAPTVRQASRGRGRAQPRGASNVQATPVGDTTPGPVVELRVSVNIKMNSVTISAEPKKLERIAELIASEWDLPRPPETAKVYTLQYTDPLKIRDLLHSLLGQGGGVSRSRGGVRTASTGAGGGQPSAVSEVIGDIYRIEAYPDSNSLVVLSKTTKALDYLDGIIDEIDQPSRVGLPLVLELKHANAVHLAEELNILLAEAGTAQGLQRPDTGLSGEGLGGIADQGAAASTASGQGAGSRGALDFPWQRARQRDDQAQESSLIGKVRIVPIIRQNALAVLAPPSYVHSVTELIREFDQPGRQVMLSAIIAEVELTDEFALGLRLSTEELVSSISDNSFRGLFAFDGSRDILGSLFDTSVLDANVSLNVLLQAIRQKTNVRILQEPRVFTADNQEAIFFDGQDVPFITQSQTISTGGVTQSFNYQQVGVFLNVRPRITAQRDVDMEINLELSSVVPGETLFGGFILDRRETSTKVIVKNGQTIVLSGILTDSESQISRKFPLLGDIPLIGELFTSRENSKITTELVAFITPVVVDNPSENDFNFNESERERLKDLSRPLKEQAKDKGKIRDRIIAPKSNVVPQRDTDDDSRPKPIVNNSEVDEATNTVIQ